MQDKGVFLADRIMAVPLYWVFLADKIVGVLFNHFKFTVA